MGTKNNPKNRAIKAEKKKLKKAIGGVAENTELEAVLYYGEHGKYMSGKAAGTTNIILDEVGKPVPWSEL